MHLAVSPQIWQFYPYPAISIPANISTRSTIRYTYSSETVLATVSQNVIPSVHEVPVNKVRGQGSGGVFNYTVTVKTRLQEATGKGDT